MEAVKTIELKQKTKSFKLPKGCVAALVVILSILVILIASVGYFIARPALSIKSKADNIKADMKDIAQSIDKKDLTQLDQRLDSIESNMNGIDSELNNFNYLKNYSFSSGYFKNLETSRKMLGQSKEILALSRPKLKVLFKSMGYKVDADDVIQTTPEGEKDSKLLGIIKSVPEVLALYEEVEPKSLELIKTFNTIDPKYVPAFVPVNISDAQKQTKFVEKEFPFVSEQIKSTLNVLPDMLGSEKPTNYLVIFQNEKELRASGGLLTAYGLLTVDKGEIIGDISSTDMWDLELYVSSKLGKSTGYVNTYGQKTLMQRGCGGVALRAQDAGIYPDAQVSMDMFKDYYNIASKANPEKYKPYDHILMLNTFFASDIISLVEPLKLDDGREISAEDMAKQIFSQTSVNKHTLTRKAIIGEIGTLLKDNFNKLPAERFPEALKTVIKSAEAKNIAFYSKNEEVSNFFDELGITARTVQDFDGDYFHLSEAQVCALKANFYIRDTVTQDIKINDDNSINKDISVEWVNDKVYDPAESEILSNLNNFLYRAWVRVMAPEGSKFTYSNGFKLSRNIYTPVTYFDKKAGKEISDNVIWFDHRRPTEKSPIKTMTMDVKYELPSNLNYDADKGYSLLIQKHPGKKNEKNIVNLEFEGKKYSIDFEMDRDKVVTFKDGELKVSNYTSPLDQYTSVLNDIEAAQHD